MTSFIIIFLLFNNIYIPLDCNKISNQFTKKMKSTLLDQVNSPSGPASCTQSGLWEACKQDLSIRALSPPRLAICLIQQPFVTFLGRLAGLGGEISLTMCSNTGLGNLFYQKNRGRTEKNTHPGYILSCSAH